MASQVKIVGTCVNDTSIGSKSWSNPGNATANDDTDAQTQKYKSSTSNGLKGTMTGNLFSIPTGATIDGIEVRAEIYAEFASVMTDATIRVLKAGTATGSDYGRGPSVFWPTGRTVVLWGGTGDKWGTTWDDTDINDADFGARIQNANPSSTRCTGYCDYIEITVYYTAAVIKDVDGELTTGIVTSASVTKETTISGSITTAVSTSATVTKTTLVSGSSTTGITTSASVSKIVSIGGQLTTNVSTVGEVTISKSVDGSITTAIATSASVTKITTIQGSLTTGISTQAQVTKEVSITGTATTGITTSASVTVTKNVEGSLTTNIATSASVTKVTSIEGSATTAIGTFASVTKEVSIEGSATTNISTYAEVEKVGGAVKDVDGVSTTAITTSASVTKITSVEGSATTGITTSGTVTKITSIEGSLTTAISTSASVTKIVNIEGSATTGITTSASVTKIVSIEGSATTGITTSASVEITKNAEGSLTTAITTFASVVVEKNVRGLARVVTTTLGFVNKIVNLEGSATTNIGTQGSVIVHSPPQIPEGTDRLVPDADITLTMFSTGAEGWTEVNRHVDYANTNTYVGATGENKIAFFDLTSATDTPFDIIEGARIEIPCDYINTGEDAAIRVILYNDVQLLFSTVVTMPECLAHPLDPLVILLFDIDSLTIPHANRDMFSIYLESEIATESTKEGEKRFEEH